MIRSLLKKVNSIKNKRFQSYFVPATNKSLHVENRRQHVELLFDMKRVRSMYPALVQEMLDELLVYHNHLPELREKYLKLINYTSDLDDIYLIFTSLTVHAYKLFEKASLITEKNLERAYILGWCHRFIASALILGDDVLDNSSLRYRKPTWRKLPIADDFTTLCDGGLMVKGTSVLLLNHFVDHPQYVNIHRETLRNCSTCIVSQIIDYEFHPFEKFEEYHDLAKAYPFTVPSILTAMYLANIDDLHIHSVVLEFLRDLAAYLKIEDDVEFHFSPKEKDNTDVIQRKVTWMALKVINEGTEAQKHILHKYYGKSDNLSLNEINALFTNMNLYEQFLQYKEEFYENSYKRIQNLPKELPGQLFLDLLDLAMLGMFRA